MLWRVLVGAVPDHSMLYRNDLGGAFCLHLNVTQISILRSPELSSLSLLNAGLSVNQVLISLEATHVRCGFCSTLCQWQHATRI